MDKSGPCKDVRHLYLQGNMLHFSHKITVLQQNKTTAFELLYPQLTYSQNS